ncbi:hypothetical protein [Anditalea andensis]|nr:hypothetical protein [Anditalea andensis]
MNLDNLSLFLTDDLVVIRDEMAQFQLAQRFKNNNLLAVNDNDSQGIDISKEAGTSQPDINEIIASLAGGYEKGIVIIYEGATLEKDVQEFLMKILGAVNCSLKDILLIGADQFENMDASVLELLNPQKVIIFGLVHHPVMQYKVDLYKIRDVGFEVLFANDLIEISMNVPLKKLLWTSLQNLFHINK